MRPIESHRFITLISVISLLFLLHCSANCVSLWQEVTFGLTLLLHTLLLLNDSVILMLCTTDLCKHVFGNQAKIVYCAGSHKLHFLDSGSDSLTGFTLI